MTSQPSVQQVSQSLSGYSSNLGKMWSSSILTTEEIKSNHNQSKRQGSNHHPLLGFCCRGTFRINRNLVVPAVEFGFFVMMRGFFVLDGTSSSSNNESWWVLYLLQDWLGRCANVLIRCTVVTNVLEDSNTIRFLLEHLLLYDSYILITTGNCLQFLHGWYIW